MSLTESELLAFCGLARLLVRLDGQLSSEERHAIAQIGPALAYQDCVPGVPYREQRAVPDDGVERFWKAMDVSAKALPTDDAIRQAALSVTGRKSQEAIHAALFELASSDTISGPEWALLEWLASAWDLQIG